MGLFSSKPKVKPEPIPMEDRPVQYVRFPACKHPADEIGCGCYDYELRFWNSDMTALLPKRRGSTKRTLVAIEDWVKHNPWDVSVLTLDRSAWVADARIPPEQRHWAVSDDTRIVYQVWLIVTRVDEDDELGDDDIEVDYEARLRFATAGQVLMFDQDDPAALVP